jgi:hypothetical protein
LVDPDRNPNTISFTDPFELQVIFDSIQLKEENGGSTPILFASQVAGHSVHGVLLHYRRRPARCLQIPHDQQKRREQSQSPTTQIVSLLHIVMSSSSAQTVGRCQVCPAEIPDIPQPIPLVQLKQESIGVSSARIKPRLSLLRHFIHCEEGHKYFFVPWNRIFIPTCLFTSTCQTKRGQRERKNKSG